MNDSQQLTHFDANGASRMVDVTAKPHSDRLAVAMGRVRMRKNTLGLILDRKMAKGDVLEVARLAGIMAAKRVDDLIPLCHSLNLSSVELSFEPEVEAGTIKIIARVRCHGPTGVEMEALTAVSVAGLTIYDMCKAVDREMSLEGICLLEKSGGRSGHFTRS
ncbi:MAG: cyclic pyranopterin monophosphate synthase MoaC [Magnetococcales bacterium]|nr:cyclic pyranopterin monophosphate synthase MoaC [Magnetococcales bacterium]MBF0148782.1 cyclic pyranopterin monophosphate synthase MoaC [Magnetococcales bacterium]MBF0174296.1 cyclic pyranopterin monophosphate synthase MoaC [Magnetococcales bacterium]MBF0632542.1 cyclic pyranopterin monophosphate synthase MoaC [Magnetococcales bacterium]